MQLQNATPIHAKLLIGKAGFRRAGGSGKWRRPGLKARSMRGFKNALVHKNDPVFYKSAKMDTTRLSPFPQDAGFFIGV